ncbi:hydroxyacid dehydrogenase [Amaricoccus tamworthensis]|uniref:hydroxyacid dehydrogenase n=1 Tax=Amaricoccus tamworthensis TaxID=57002 RepID=UPI003C7ACBE7
MPHVLVAGNMHPSGQTLLKDAGHTVHHIPDITEESYAPFVDGADALIIRTQPLSAETLARAGKLAIVCRHGVGYDAVDVPALNARGIPLMVCGDVNSYSVAEHACMMILAASKRVLRADASVRHGPWKWRNSLESQDLRGRNLLILGFGRIGRHTANMMAGFGMTIRAHDPYITAENWPEGPVQPAPDLHEALAWADVVSVSAPKSDRPLIDRAEFDAMRDGTIVVNTARGGIVNELALAEALKSGRVGAAGIDVFDPEPPAEAHPLKGFDQVILSPHIAGVTDGASQRMATGSAQNVIDFFNGKPDLSLVVNRAHTIL